MISSKSVLGDRRTKVFSFFNAAVARVNNVSTDCAESIFEIRRGTEQCVFASIACASSSIHACVIVAATSIDIAANALVAGGGYPVQRRTPIVVVVVVVVVVVARARRPRRRPRVVATHAFVVVVARANAAAHESQSRTGGGAASSSDAMPRSHRRRRRAAAVAALVAALVANVATVTRAQCSSAPPVAADRRRDAASARVTVATFNAKFLFDGVDDVKASPYNSGDDAADVAAASAHIAAVRDDVVKALDVDVLVIAEAETCGTLTRVAAASADYATGMVDGTDTFTAQEVGLLTKVDVVVDIQRTEARGQYAQATSKCGYVGEKDSGVSKHFWTRVKIVDRYVSIIAAHLKANPTEASSCAQREAQVEVLRGLISARYAVNDAVIVLGDLNDYSAKYVDVSGNAPTSQVLARLRDFDDDGVDELEEVSSLISQSSRYTYQSESGYSKAMLDHILVSKADVDIVDATIRHDVVTSHSVSDHFPVVSTLDILAGRNESRLGNASSSTPRNASVPFALVVAIGVAGALLRVAY